MPDPVGYGQRFLSLSPFFVYCDGKLDLGNSLKFKPLLSIAPTNYLTYLKIVPAQHASG